MKSTSCFTDVFNDLPFLNQIWSQFLEYLDKIVLIYQTAALPEKEYKIRCPDFAYFMELVGPLFQKDQVYVDRCIDAIKWSQDQLAAQGSAITELVRLFKIEIDNGAYQNKYYHAAELYDAFVQHFNQGRNQRFKYGSPTTFGKALHENRKSLMMHSKFAFRIKKKQTEYYFVDAMHPLESETDQPPADLEVEGNLPCLYTDLIDVLSIFNGTSFQFTEVMTSMSSKPRTYSTDQIATILTTWVKKGYLTHPTIDTYQKIPGMKIV